MNKSNIQNNNYSSIISQRKYDNSRSFSGLEGVNYNSNGNLAKDDVNIYGNDNENNEINNSIDEKEKELNEYRNEIDNIINNFKKKKFNSVNNSNINNRNNNKNNDFSYLLPNSNENQNKRYNESYKNLIKGNNNILNAAPGTIEYIDRQRMWFSPKHKKKFKDKKFNFILDRFSLSDGDDSLIEKY